MVTLNKEVGIELKTENEPLFSVQAILKKDNENGSVRDRPRFGPLPSTRSPVCTYHISITRNKFVT